MSVEALCTGDQVVRQVEANSIGASFGNTPTYTNGATLDCLIQTVGASEVLKYQARGMDFTHVAFFAENPSLSNANRLKWTLKDGTTLTPAVFLRVLDCYREGRPGEELLWVVDLSEETTRMES